MTERRILNDDGLAEALRRLAGWSVADSGRAIEKTFVFADFDAAFAFMARVAESARVMDHHPDWSNSYGRVRIRLSTHDAGGVTAMDVRLAQLADEAAFLS